MTEQWTPADTTYVHHILSYTRAAHREFNELGVDYDEEVRRLLAFAVGTIESQRAELEAVKKAGHDLLLARLSTSTGGDPGMIFDASDYAVEQGRGGTVTFDRRAVDRFERTLRSQHATSGEDAGDE